MSESYIIIRAVEPNPFIDRGLFNGYISLPNGHPWFGKHYDEIDARVHGGLTYAQFEGDRWVIGFDTAHLGDTESRWPIDAVARECNELLLQAQGAEMLKQ